MLELTPDLSDETRCVSVHWSLPVQCVLSRAHGENWHEAWHPETGNRLRYRRAFGTYATEENHHGAWHPLDIPAPAGEHEAEYGVVFDRPDPKDLQYAWGPFDEATATAFAAFVSREIDPAKVLPWAEATALPGVQLRDPIAELLAWRESVALPRMACLCPDGPGVHQVGCPALASPAGTEG